jgi:hypothetical protein
MIRTGRKPRQPSSLDGAQQQQQQQRYKLVFYTPSEALERIKSAIFAAGGGTFPGQAYACCSFESTGTTQFQRLANGGANSPVGHRVPETDGLGLERVYEVRCEIMCVGADVVRTAVDALKR